MQLKIVGHSINLHSYVNEALIIFFNAFNILKIENISIGFIVSADTILIVSKNNKIPNQPNFECFLKGFSSAVNVQPLNVSCFILTISVGHRKISNRKNYSFFF